MSRTRRIWCAILGLVAVLATGPGVAGPGTDARIVAAARGSYTFKTILRGDAIEIKASQGCVTLRGTVSEDLHRSLAEETVANLPGVSQVKNELQVKPDQPQERSDGWITLKVKTALLFHRKVSGTGTTVTTENGVVTLGGVARSEAERQLVTEYAKDVEGVKEVRNTMTVGGRSSETVGRKIDDASITAQVKASLLFNRGTRGLATRVHTRRGVVTVKGEARSQAEKELVTRVAQDVDGVRRVDNQMTAPAS